MRVHELAKELGVTSKELLEALARMGVDGKSASSSVPEDMVPRLRASGGAATTPPARPREILEPPPQPRKPRPKKVSAAEAAPAVKTGPAPSAGEDVAAAASGGGTATAVMAPPAPPAPPKRTAVTEPDRPEPAGPTLQVVHGATPQVIAEKLDRSPADIVKILFMAGDMVTATTSLSDDAIELVA
jgi:translation initiation factor IF-2